jgi:hypothetical protein
MSKLELQCPSLGNDIVPNVTGSLPALDSIYRYTSVDLDNEYPFANWPAYAGLLSNGLDH